MARFAHFLRCVGRAVVKNGARALAGLVPFGDIAFDIARDTYEDYRKGHGERDLRAELEGLAQASPTEVRCAAEAVATQEAAGRPVEVRQTLTSYLTQLPASIRQSLRRPADPSGKTVPAGRPLQKPEDLLPFLPTGLPRFKPGDQPLAADWVLVELLGRGGFGEVWKAQHVIRSGQRPVALKFCLDAAAAHSLRNEAALHDLLDRVRQQGSRLGIVPLLETYLRADPPCLMYEYIEGGDLTSLMQEMHQRGKLTPVFATRVVHRLASIVGLAHRLDPPLVHRDLKPSNVLVRREEGNKLSFFVTDFGIGGLAAGQLLREQASRRSVRGLTLPTAVRGAYTPLYASPEQARGERPDPRDDVHALGVLWYQLVTGDLRMLAIPPDWQDVVEKRGMSKAQVEVLASCLASRADKRPADADDLARRLTPLLPPEERSGPELPKERVDNGLDIKFAWIPPGTFLMGSPPPYPKPNQRQHQVTLTTGFYLGIYPVTRGQFARFVQATGYKTEAETGGGAHDWTGKDYKLDPAKNWRTPGFDQTDDHPVVCISWNDATAFCEWLTRQDRQGWRYHLPTEAEWEYACRAGTNSDYHTGDGVEALGQAGWYYQNSGQHTHPVGQKEPNAWKLYDMHGNVWEWCADWYGRYGAKPLVDPRGPDNRSYRGMRGGSWCDEAGACRAAYRGYEPPRLRGAWAGFRVCFSPG